MLEVLEGPGRIRPKPQKDTPLSSMGYLSLVFSVFVGISREDVACVRAPQSHVSTVQQAECEKFGDTSMTGYEMNVAAVSNSHTNTA